MGEWLSKLFGGTSSPPQKQNHVSDHDRAVLELKVQRDRLSKCVTLSESAALKEKQAASAFLKEKKTDRAKLCLRKKKYQEKLIENARNKILTVEQLISSIEEAESQAKVFSALKEGNAALKTLNEQVSIEDVERLMEETEEAVAYQQEVDALLSRELTAADDDAVLEELATIEELDAKEAQIQMPSVPVSGPRLAEKVQESMQETKTLVLG
jgi:charged multivesicular body protein 6